MNDYITGFAVIACILLLLFSCSVKEDRLDCPVQLSLDISSYGIEDQGLVISTTNENVIIKQYYYPGLSDSLLLFSMPKGELFISGITTLSSCYVADMKVLCPEGRQYDRLFTYSNTIKAMGEYASDRIIMHKQYTLLELDLAHIITKDDFVDKLTVKGNYSGLDLIDGTPLTLPYKTRCDCIDSTHFLVRVPRQGDDRLELDLVMSSGKILTFPIGTMLRQSGFDWNAEDLDDARIEIVTIEAGVTITIQDWETGFAYVVHI